MINLTVQTGSLGSAYTPQSELLITLNNVTFIVLNILSLGKYGVKRIVEQQRKIQHIKCKQARLASNTQELLERFENLKNKIFILEKEVQQIHLTLNFDKRIEDINITNEQLKKRSLESELNNEQSLVMQNFAVPRITFLGLLLANIVSIGFYSFYQFRQNKLHIENLKKETENFQVIISQRQIELAEQITNQLNFLRRTKSLKVEIARLPIGNDFFKINEKKERLKWLAQEIERLDLEVKNLVKQNAGYEVEKLGSVAFLKCRVKDLENLNTLITEKAKKMLSKKTSDDPISALEELKARVRREQEQTQKLFQLKKDLERESADLTPTEKIYSQIGQINQAYARLENQGVIPGDYGLNFDGDFDPSKETEYVKNYKGIKTAREFLEVLYANSFKELVELAKHGKINFNKHLNTVIDELNCQALYRFMVLKFMTHSRLEENGCRGYLLKLNADGVSLAAPAAEIVLDCPYGEIAKSNHLRRINRVVDEFTYAVEPQQISLPPYDPESLKRLLVDLSEEEKLHLFNLVMEDLIEEDHPEMINTRKFLQQKDNQRVEKIKTTFQLICNFAVTLKAKFGPQHLLILKNLYDDEGVEPFKKFKEETVELKTASTSQTVTIPWTPNHACLDPNLKKIIRDTVKTYQDFYKGLNCEAINPKGQICPTNYVGIDMQYWHKHPYFSRHGCLMSAFSALLTIERELVSVSTVKQLKNAIAAYLDIPEKAAQFKNQIYNKYKLSLEKYQSYMRGENCQMINVSDFGELEIQLMAEVIGVKIAVIIDSEAAAGQGLNQSLILNEFGLTVPESSYYYFGPNTLEVLYLYKTTFNGNGKTPTYEPLWPKVKNSTLLTPESKSAYEKIYLHAYSSHAYSSVVF
ncbi:Uncharacterized protein PRO82_000550 [Candidatus Protochlamydia amoebophila]|uniref:OTU domain-containing protein n=1 Tax=Candidatus Protochlamydia amoebophila TaxID=362787 RepID=UPI001BC9856C|nr:OTU domain-containing protein [Candidatus Protochlamydia amoebophila]MBS4163250.1 Uncharacterized protein [Candidatus Protochlamydia amoebophila]